jgi:long-chain acyl-CoA synthetase
MEADLGRRIINYLEKQTGAKKTIVPGDLLELDLGVDSLGRIELAAGLEKLLRVEIKDEIVGNAFTVRDLIQGIEPLLPSGAKMPEEEAIPSALRNWKEMLKGPPAEENLAKIDLSPGFGAWLACFLFTRMLKVIFKTFYSLKVEGRENFPRGGPYILYVNHTSYFDGFLVGAAVPHFLILDLFFVGFRPYFTVPVTRDLVKVGRIIPLDFSSHFLEALKSCYYVLENGKNLCLFPEGLRTLNGEVGNFKKGFGILAKETKVKQLVPILIEGAYEAWPRTSTFPKRHPIKVKIGKLLEIDQLEKEGLEEGASDSYDAICIAAKKHLVEMKGKK